MKKIGVTGGIGSGKTIVCEIFRILGAKVYNADIRAREIINSNEVVMDQIRQFFGDEVYTSGQANRQLLAGKVFNNPAMLSKLNSIVHPAVQDDFDEWLLRQRNQDYIIKEAAILFESGTYKYLDSVVLVFSPVETRIERVIKRDNTSRESVLTRMKNQMNDEDKMKLSNYIIYNDDNHSLIKQVINLHNTFKA